MMSVQLDTQSNLWQLMSIFASKSGTPPALDIYILSYYQPLPWCDLQTRHLLFQLLVVRHASEPRPTELPSNMELESHQWVISRYLDLCGSFVCFSYASMEYFYSSVYQLQPGGAVCNISATIRDTNYHRSDIINDTRHTTVLNDLSHMQIS